MRDLTPASDRQLVAEALAYLGCGKPVNYLYDADVFLYLLECAGWEVSPSGGPYGD